MYMHKTICVFLYIHTMFASAQDEDSTVKIVTIETTTQEVIIVTDISQEEVDKALKIEVGEYTTMVFNYINTQFSKLIPGDKCYDDYIKCTLTKGITMPVCVVRDYGNIYSFASYCEAYLDNCRLNERLWFIIDYGYCERVERIDDIWQSRRRLGLLGQPWNFKFENKVETLN